MSLWVIVPIKPLRRGKSRLAGVLNEDERTTLNQVMFIHTLVTLKEVPEIDQVLVVSRDPAALALARAHQARTLQEHGAPQLNQALKRAMVVAQRYASQGVLILPADLPLITPHDIRKLVEYAHDPPVVVISPDRHKQGTNALLMHPTHLIEHHFGPGSFDQHCLRALQAGARLEICELPALALDIDLPEDLQLSQIDIHSLTQGGQDV